MSYIKEQAQEEDCEPCRFAIGIRILANLCEDLKDSKIDCGQLKRDVDQEKITVAEFVNKVKTIFENNNSLDAEAQLEIFNEVKTIMFKKKGEQFG